jgi:transcriptional regulator with PAS, ATPase and Fis domain
MNSSDWMKEFPGAITLCDTSGRILEMNDKAEINLQADGGRELIGKNALDCHPEEARLKFEKMLETASKNIYTIEKNGVKKLIYQVPWYANGEYAGFVELALEIPFELPHFIRS